MRNPLLPACALWFALALSASAALLGSPATATAAELCSNEQYRQASDSTRLPDCRAYELVSPADAGGTVGTLSLSAVTADNDQIGRAGAYVAEYPAGGLAQQLQGALDVQGGGEDVFWDSTATLPGTGAVEDAGAWDPFRSVRTSSGWSTRDLLPSGLQTPEAPGRLPKLFVGASADGSSALVLTSLALYPSAYANPQQAALGEWRGGFSIYRVSTDGGFAPQLVTHGEFLLPEEKTLESLAVEGPFQELSASPNLSVVTFRSTIPLESSDNCTGRGTGFGNVSTYLWNASSVDGLAHVILDFNGGCTSPNVTGVSAVLPDGRPILMVNPVNSPNYGDGPVVENDVQGRFTPLAGPSGGALLSVTPDGSTAYVQASEALDSHFPGAGGNNIYAVSTTLGTASEGGATPGVTCISCISDQTDVTYVTTSKDGAHVLFTTDQGLWEWDSSSGAQLLTSATDLGPLTVAVSENGQYAVGLTSQLAHNPNGTADLYEFSAGQLPTLITSGGSADVYSFDSIAREEAIGGPLYVSGGVSNDGRRVVYNARSPEGGGQLTPGVIDEWDAGRTTQLSPPGSPSEYSVEAVAGDELQDVFFIAHDALVPWDLNAGQADFYDARADGGFPFCTSGNPGPPPGVERCGTTTSNANPTVPPIPGYPTSLTSPSFQLASLPADTSQPAGTPKPKSLTRAQKLAKALRTCRGKPRKKQAACKAQARKKYGAKASRRSEKGRK
jgi:hypothetical protein